MLTFEYLSNIGFDRASGEYITDLGCIPPQTPKTALAFSRGGPHRRRYLELG
jgi:hypothetical protein